MATLFVHSLTLVCVFMWVYACVCVCVRDRKEPSAMFRNKTSIEHFLDPDEQTRWTLAQYHFRSHEPKLKHAVGRYIYVLSTVMQYLLWRS